MAMNLPARLCPRSAFGPVCGDDRVIMSSRSPTESRGIGFVKLECISTFYSSSSGIIKDLTRFLTLDAETLQSGDQTHRRAVAGSLRLAAGADARPDLDGEAGPFLEEARWHMRSIKIASKPVSPVRRSASTAGTPVSA